jgi:hypothetical protein
MTPSNFRAGGTSAEIKFAIGQCSLGSILVAASKKDVCTILLGEDPDALVRDLQDRFLLAQVIGGDQGSSAWSRMWSALSRRPRSGLIFHSMSAEPHSSIGSKRLYATFRTDRRRAMRISPNVSGIRGPRAPPPKPGPQTRSLWRFLAIAWSGMTGLSPDIAGCRTETCSYSTERPIHERRVDPGIV